MEHDLQRRRSIANKTFYDSLVDGFKLFTQNYGKLILPLAFFQILLIILDILLLTDLKLYVDSLGLNIANLLNSILDTTPLTESEMNLLTSFILWNFALLFLQYLIGAIIITIAMCSVSNYTFRKYMGEDVSFMESFKSAFNKKIFIVILIVGIMIPVSSLLLFVPAIIIFGFFIFLVFTYNLNNENPIKEAKRIAKGAFSKIIGVFIVNFFIIFIFNFILTTALGMISWTAPTTRNYGMLILYQLIYGIVEIIFAPLFICFLTTLFSSLKARKDLGYSPIKNYSQERFPQPVQESFIVAERDDDIKQSDLQSKDSFFCPFCGHLIKTPKKFCSKCGESLDFLGTGN